MSFLSIREYRWLLLGIASSAIGCSSSTEPIHEPPPRQITHPSGDTATTVTFDGLPHGIAIASDGTMLIARLSAFDIVPGNVDSLSFSPAVPMEGVPTDVALAPDASTAFIPFSQSPTVAIYDVASASVTGSLTVAPGALRALVTPDGNHVYVTSSRNNDTLSTLYDFDARTHALLDSILVGPQANGIAYDPVHSRLFVSSRDSNTVFEIDATNDVVTARIPVAAQPQDVAVSLDGSELWVATEGSAGVQVYDAATGDFIVSVPNTSSAFGLKMSPDGAQFYVARSMEGLCTVIDARSRQVVKSFHTGSEPRRIAFNATGSRAVVTDEYIGIVVIR